jgi:hypothetical protein
MKTLLAIALVLMSLATAVAAEPQLKIGIIGLDTSHVVAFTKALNDQGRRRPRRLQGRRGLSERAPILNRVPAASRVHRVKT